MYLEPIEVQFSSIILGAFVYLLCVSVCVFVCTCAYVRVKVRG